MDPLLLGYVSLTAALVVTPGATTAVVVRNTLASGWRGGIFAALGAALANSIHATAAGLGLAVLVAQVPAVLIAIKVAGGLYLAWLGITSARRVLTDTALPASSAILSAGRDVVPHHAVREGLTVNLLNPAIATFYLAVVPSFLPAGATHGYYAALATIQVGMALLCHSVWAIGMDRLRHALERPAARTALEVVTATALLTIAGRVLLSAKA